MCAFRENQLLAFLRRVSLDDPDAAKRFAEASRHFRIDLAALAEEWAKAFECRRHADAERGEDHDGHGGQAPVQIEKDADRHDGGQDRTGQLYETRPNEIADALGVRHDARNQDAALRRVEVTDRQPHDVRFDVLAHVGDGPLRGDAQDLGVTERRDRVHEGRHAHSQGKFRQQVPMVLEDHVVHQELRRVRQDEAGQPADDHHPEAQREPAAMFPDERARLDPRLGAQAFFLRRLWSGGQRSSRSRETFWMGHTRMILNCRIAGLQD